MGTFNKMYSEFLIADYLGEVFYGNNPENEAIDRVKDLANTGEASTKKKLKDLSHAFASSEAVGKFGQHVEGLLPKVVDIVTSENTLE